MAPLQLVIAPNPIFKHTAEPVTDFDEDLEKLTSEMLETLYTERGIGMAAPMVGITKRIIVIDLQEEGRRSPLICINPGIEHLSATMSSNEEASLCFPGIRASITRPDEITLRYQDTNGDFHTLDAAGWLSTVIQHEMEYLDGRTFLDNLSKLKRDRLIKKMLKDQKHAQSCHDPHCGHDHH